MRCIWLGLALMVAGCASAGVKVDPQVAASFKPGVTTYQDVEQKLGPPTSQMVMSDGSRMIGYTYARTTTRPETFIPFVGAFVGGADTRSQTVQFHFTPTGVLDTTQSGTNAIGVGTGFAAGTSMDRTDQPKASP